jgi:hypothetical protein
MISDFRCGADEVLDLKIYAALTCSYLPTFRNRILAPYSKVKQSKKREDLRHMLFWFRTVERN